ncbi:MAG TPA: DUF2141 domain-containing protein [Ginsengibacter sp.]|nr:DUF2141 domain-containing protein [Agriterribacter sp.]HRP43258.1 DUF2141 domain-containing protein [Ginsengibacter sp.]
MKLIIFAFFISLNMIGAGRYFITKPGSRQAGYSLTVQAEGLRNSAGIVRFALYNKDETIPDEHFRNYFKLGSTTITDNKAEFTFTGLPEGNYAVSALHDENENWKIDKRFMKPKEGIGFSNIKSIGLSNRPNFKKASFSLSEDKKIVIKMIYM